MCYYPRHCLMCWHGQNVTCRPMVATRDGFSVGVATRSRAWLAFQARGGSLCKPFRLKRGRVETGELRVSVQCKQSEAARRRCLNEACEDKRQTCPSHRGPSRLDILEGAIRARVKKSPRFSHVLVIAEYRPDEARMAVQVPSSCKEKTMAG